MSMGTVFAYIGYLTGLLLWAYSLFRQWKVTRAFKLAHSPTEGSAADQAVCWQRMDSRRFRQVILASPYGQAYLRARYGIGAASLLVILSGSFILPRHVMWGWL